MARLKSHGTELLRLRREYFIDGERPSTFNGVTTWVKIQTKHYEERSYRSDGKILQKSGYWQEATPYQNAHWYDWGWKQFRKLKPGIDPVEHANKARQAVLNAVASEWRIIQ